MALCKGMKGKSEKKIGVKISSLEGSLPCRCLYAGSGALLPERVSPQIDSPSAHFVPYAKWSASTSFGSITSLLAASSLGSTPDLHLEPTQAGHQLFGPVPPLSVTTVAGVTLQDL